MCFLFSLTFYTWFIRFVWLGKNKSGTRVLLLKKCSIDVSAAAHTTSVKNVLVYDIRSRNINNSTVRVHKSFITTLSPEHCIGFTHIFSRVVLARDLELFFF